MPFYSGVAYRFGILNAGAYVASPVLCGTALYHQMPVDGNGVHAILFRTEDLEQVAPCAQMFLWGTGEDDSPPDGRAGTQHRLQYDDDFPKDGRFHPVDECYDYTYGLVPDPLGPMILFYAEMTPPCAPCDLDCDGSINAFDVEPFVGRLSGDNGCSACAGDTNADGSVNGFDIQGFVECLGG